VPQVGNPWLKEFSECPKVLCSCVISLSLPEIGCLVSLYALMYPSSQRSTWNKFIPAIRAPGKFTRVLCYFCHYVWGQHCCWTDTSIIGNDIFFLKVSIALPSITVPPTPLLWCPWYTNGFENKTYLIRFIVRLASMTWVRYISAGDVMLVQPWSFEMKWLLLY